MLTERQIEKAKIKMIKESLNCKGLAKTIGCSQSSLSYVFNGLKNLPKVEKSIKDWLEGTIK